MRTIDTIVVHSSATKPSSRVTVKTIEGWHKERGFHSIGYHHVIGRDGIVYAGRPETTPGAHVQGHNARSIGVCLIGGLNEKTGAAENNYTLPQMISLARLIKATREKYPSIKRVVGHRDLSPDLNRDGKISPNEWVKQCPCFDVGEWMETTYPNLIK